MARISRKLYCGGGVGAMCNMWGQTTAMIVETHGRASRYVVILLSSVRYTKPTLLPSAGIFGGDDEGIVGTTSGHNRLISQG